MSKEGFLLGKVQVHLQKEAEQLDKYLALLQQKKERLESGGVWHSKEETIESINTIMEYKLKDLDTVLTLLKEMCKLYDLCDGVDEVQKMRDERVLKLLKEKHPKVLDKLLDELNPVEAL